MNKRINVNHLLAAIALFAGGVIGLYASLKDGFDGFYFVPSCIFVFVGAIYARNIRIK